MRDELKMPRAKAFGPAQPSDPACGQVASTAFGQAPDGIQMAGNVSELHEPTSAPKREHVSTSGSDDPIRRRKIRKTSPGVSKAPPIPQPANGPTTPEGKRKRPPAPSSSDERANGRDEDALDNKLLLDLE